MNGGMMKLFSRRTTGKLLTVLGKTKDYRVKEAQEAIKGRKVRLRLALEVKEITAAMRVIRLSA